MFHRGASGPGQVFEGTPHCHGGDAIDGSIMDPVVRPVGGRRFGGVPGERAGHHELPGRKSDVQESQWLLKLHTYGLLRNSFRPISEIRGAANVLAPASGTHPHGNGMRTAAHAEGADADESAVGQRDIRHYGRDGTGDSARDSCRRTGCRRSWQSCETGAFKPAARRSWLVLRQAARGTGVCLEAGGSALRLLPAAD